MKNTKKRYDSDLLRICIQRDKAILIGEYNYIINRETEITYLCECKKEGKKGFRYLVDHGAFCKDCQRVIQLNKRKQTNLELFGVENVMKKEEFRKKAEETNLKKNGAEYVEKKKEIQSKISKTIKERNQTQKL